MMNTGEKWRRYQEYCGRNTVKGIRDKRGEVSKVFVLKENGEKWHFNGGKEWFLSIFFSVGDGGSRLAKLF